MALQALGLLELLSNLVEAKYQAAQRSSTLIFSSTVCAVIEAWGVPFHLRYCPALSKKPTERKSDVSNHADHKERDPFKNPKDLLVTQIPVSQPTHNIVLNKYPIICQRFILSTIAYKGQDMLLEKSDLDMVYSSMKAWETTKVNEPPTKRLFAFYNSGPHSGASQRHRHVRLDSRMTSLILRVMTSHALPN